MSLRGLIKINHYREQAYLDCGVKFGKQWTGMMGWTPEQMEAGKAKMKKDGWKTYLMAFIGSLVMALVLGYFLVFTSYYLDITGISAGMQTGFFAWLGFVAPVTLGAVLWEGRPWKLWFLMNGYYLVALLIMGSILAAWM